MASKESKPNTGIDEKRKVSAKLSYEKQPRSTKTLAARGAGKVKKDEKRI